MKYNLSFGSSKPPCVLIQHGNRILHRLVGPSCPNSARRALPPPHALGATSEEEQRELDRLAVDLAERLANLGESFRDDEDEFVQEAPSTSSQEKRKPSAASLPPKLRQKRAQDASRRGDAPRQRDMSQIPTQLLPKLAIVGRPNVGKSALFNRLTGTQKAVVYDYPGVTRDRLYHRANWSGQDFVVVDTGGIQSDASSIPTDVARAFQAGDRVIYGKDSIPTAIERQAAFAVEEAHVIILVVDGQEGLTGADEEILQWLRRHHAKKPVILAVNKCENVGKAELQAAPFWEMGVEPVPISAISGFGTGELLDKVLDKMPQLDLPDDWNQPQDVPLRIAIVGKPNVGKSSLLNALVGEERSIVSELAGTTRDAIDTEFKGPDGKRYILVDTAGIRKRAAIASSPDGAEELSVQRSLRAIQRADVVILVLDVNEGVTVQDFRIAETIAEEGRGCIIVVNKWDSIAKDTNTMVEKEKDVKAQLRPIEWAPIVFASAKNGQRVTRVLEIAKAAGDEHARRISTATLNMAISEATHWRSPPTSKTSGRKGRVYYATQAAVRPPSFVFFVNDPILFTDDYRKYIERQLREQIGFPGTSIRVYWRGKPKSEASGGVSVARN